MTIEWLAGNRLRGTTAERPNFGLPSGSVGGWVELGRHTFGSALETLDVSSLPDKRYYMVLAHYLDSGSTAPATVWRFNADTGTNYAYRRNADGGTDSTSTSQTYMSTAYNNIDTTGFELNYIANLSSKEKLLQGHQVYQSTAGAATAPNRVENACKWANTSNAVDQIQINTVTAGRTYGTGSEMVVLGWDPADTHTTNFWEELASVQGDGTSTTLSSGTIQSKKYLWVQGFTGDAGGANNSGLQFNSDTGSNYATRRNLDGGSDTLWTSESYTQLGTSTNCFFNTFIINNSANEKLAITNWVQRLSTGAGTAPSRGQFVGKWANTSSQITNISLVQQTTSINWGTDVHLKVWGAD
jgi:hypothetical protein